MHRLINSVSALVTIIAWWKAYQAYGSLPSRIPVHFNILGRPDGWGGRWMIYFLPALASVMTPLWMLGFTNFRNARNLTVPMRLPYALLLLAIVGGFLYINQKIIQCARGEAAGLGWGFLPIFLLLVLGLSGWMTAVGGGQ